MASGNVINFIFCIIFFEQCLRVLDNIFLNLFLKIGTQKKKRQSTLKYAAECLKMVLTFLYAMKLQYGTKKVYLICSVL